MKTTRPASPELVRALAPRGRLRVSINVGNPILANLNANGQPEGISVDMAAALAAELGLESELLVFDAAGKSVAAVKGGQADIGFFAIDPLRGEGVAFTDAYVVIEGAYLVRSDSWRKDNSEVDQAGTTVVVAKDSAYDLFLTRELKAATLVRTATSREVADTFVSGGHDVAAGVRQPLEKDAARIGGLRMLPGHFMLIRQAMGLPKTSGVAAHAYLCEFVERRKSSGFVAESMARHAIQGAALAPPASAIG
jgi:polar amino acid transport system substrate-binding protein